MIDKIELFCLNILEKIGLKKLSNIYKKHQQAMKYIIFGGLTTLVNIIVYLLFARIIFKNFADYIRVNLSNSLALVLSIAFAYITNKLYVFKSTNKNKKELIQEIGKFIGCRVFTAIIDIVLLEVTVVIMHWHEILMKILVNILVIVLNFIFSKIIVFKNKEREC